MAEDIIEIEILPDGTIKSTTPERISPSNHSNADQFFRAMEDLAGAKAERQRKRGVKIHQHQHQHEEQ